MFKLSNWELVSHRLLYGLLIIIPLAFWPGDLFTFSATKKYLFFFILLLIAAFYLLSGLRKSSLSRLPSWWVVVLWAPVLATFLASLASGAPRHSLIGLGLEPDTFLSLLMLSLLASLIPLIWSSRRQIFNTLLILLGVTAVVGIFQGLLLLGNFTFLNVFDSPVVNLIGKWNELGIFMGLGAVISLAFIEFLPWRQTKPLAVLTIITLVLSLASLVLVNFFLAWLLVAIVALIILGLKLFTITAHSGFSFKSLLTPASLVLLISLIFFWFGQYGNTSRLFATTFDLGTSISRVSDSLGIQALEVYPSWTGTWQTAKGVLSSDSILGIGPNKFSNQWFKSRPGEVNETIFWQDEFQYGSGIVPSTLVTGGLVTLATYLLLLGTIIFSGLSLLQRRANLDPLALKLGLITWLATVYLWATAILYIPGVVIIVLTFFFTGLLIVALNERDNDLGSTSEGNTWLNKLLAAFGTSGGLVVVFILLALIIQSGWSNFTYNRGLAVALRGDFNRGEVLIARAASFNPNDLYSRSLVDIDLLFMDQLFQAKNLKPEEAQSRFQTILTAAIGNAKAARDYNPTNYLNWLFLARVYETVVPFKVEGAYEEAVKSYNEAKRLNPTMPSIWLNLARLEIAAGNTAAARDYLDQALKLKRNYTEAIFVLAQLDSTSGNLDRAIDLAEQSTKISPGDPVPFFSLGLLNYQAKNFVGARDSLEQAVALNNNYANARYFLGLSYDALGNTARALEQFKALLPTNNTPEIKQIITNLEAGRAALSNTPPPAPEDRETLPVKDEE